MKNEDDLPPSGSGRGESEALAQAARCLDKINRPFADDPQSPPPDQGDLVAALAQSLDGGGTAETMLLAQAHILDAMFKRIVFYDIHTVYTDKNGIHHLDDDKLKCALRAQRHARATFDTLRRYKAREEKK